jgi:excinuclease UvrABC nuclease subunit|tara:strand:- start:743 stop:973 length:231 start_codon:yes stop_codon:yes gene_type:complete
MTQTSFFETDEELFYELQRIFTLFEHDAWRALIVAQFTIDLHEAVQCEDFEQAVRLRDRIKKHNMSLDEELSETFI